VWCVARGAATLASTLDYGGSACVGIRQGAAAPTLTGFVVDAKLLRVFHSLIHYI